MTAAHLAPPRILFALPTLRGGGAERVVVTLLRHLDRRRFDPHLVVVDAVGPYVSEVPRDVTMHVLGERRVRRSGPKMLRTIRRLRPAVVVSTQGYLNFVLLLLRPFYRSRLVVREVIGERYFENSRYQHLLYRLYLRLVSRADRIVTQSDAAARNLSSRASMRTGQLRRIYNPVDTEALARSAQTASSPFEAGGAHLLAAGRLSHQKGFDLLLEALGGVLAAGVRATLTILGEGPERHALEAQARRLGVAHAVRFAGFRDDVSSYYAHADLFVLSSRYEGLPNVLLEALALGCPVVAFDCPHGVREIVRHGENGLLLPPEDVDALTAALTRLLEAPPERARLRATLPATLAPFTVRTVIRQWEELLEDLTSRAEAVPGYA